MAIKDTVDYEPNPEHKDGHKLNDLPIPEDKRRDRWERIVYDRLELMRIAGFLQKHQFGCDGEDFIVAQSGASGIGTNTIVRCCRCNDSADCSSYENW